MDGIVCHVMTPYAESLEDPNLLVYAHAQEGLECLDCHHAVELQAVHEKVVAGKPVKARQLAVDVCFDCHIANEHTSYAQVIERTADYMISEQNINPHDPHAGVQDEGEGLGPYACYTCHKMHKESPLINGCYGCHHTRTFESCSTGHEE